MARVRVEVQRAISHEGQYHCPKSQGGRIIEKPVIEMTEDAAAAFGPDHVTVLEKVQATPTDKAVKETPSKK